MNNQHLSKRKQIIKNIAMYSFLLMLTLNLFFISTDKINAEKIESVKTSTHITEEKKKKYSDRGVNVIAYEYLEAKDYVNASKEFLYVIEHTKNLTDTNKQLAYSYMSLSWCLHKLGKEEQSLWTLKQFLHIFKNSPTPYIQKQVTKAELLLNQS